MSSSIPCPVALTAQQNPNAVAVVTDSGQLSYLDLDHAIRGVQVRLRQSGLSKADRIAIVSPNSLEYVVALLAAWREGVVVCPISPRFPKNLMTSILERTACQAFDLTGILEEKEEDICHRDRLDFQIALEQYATMILTSGSSGEPKIAVHTFGNHYFNALGAAQNIPLGCGDRWLLSLPLYHAGGMAIVVRAILAGAVIVIPDEAESLAGAIEKYQLTHVSLVPTQAHRLLQNPRMIPHLSRLKVVLLGGAPIPERLLAEAENLKLPVYITYGLTEMASQVATGSPGAPLRAQVLPYRELMLAEDGEILLRGRTLFAGYWQGGSVIPSLTDQGWFPTGDIGQWDSANTLKVRGRKDNMFISGGENIYPEEIENVLCQFEGIEAAVVVPREDEEFGMRPAAFLKITRSREELSLPEIQTFLRAILPGFKIPMWFYEWPEAGEDEELKLDRRSFRQYLQEPKNLKKIW